MSDEPYERHDSPERWRGKVDEKLSTLQSTSATVFEKISKIDDKVEQLQNQVTRLIVYVGLGAFFGSAIVSVIVGVVIKAVTK